MIKNTDYVSKEDIARYVDQMEVWWWLLGFQVDEGEYFKNPWRIDNYPRCMLTKGYKWIFFQDFATRGRSNSFHNWTIIHAVRHKFNLNMSDACDLIWQTFILNNDKPLVPQTRIINHDKTERAKCHIHFIPYVNNDGKATYLTRDKMFWSPIGVTSEQLREDYTYSVLMFRFNDRGGRLFQVYPNSWSYAYTDFASGNVKIYCPGKDVGKWTSNTDDSDIGGLRHLPKTGEVLFICKSYKDWRIQINLGFNAVWVQEESAVIPEDYLVDWAKRFKKIIFYYDNDNTGIECALKNKERYNQEINYQFYASWLPEELKEKDITDNAEYYLAFGEKALYNQIQKFIYDTENSR